MLSVIKEAKQNIEAKQISAQTGCFVIGGRPEWGAFSIPVSVTVSPLPLLSGTIIAVINLTIHSLSTCFWLRYHANVPTVLEIHFGTASAIFGGGRFTSMSNIFDMRGLSCSRSLQVCGYQKAPLWYLQGPKLLVGQARSPLTSDSCPNSMVLNFCKGVNRLRR